MFPRIREITDAFGGRLRLSVEEHPSGALVVIERPDAADRARVLLDGYGCDVLAGYVMSARLAVPHGLPNEHVDGNFGASFRLDLEPCAAICIAEASGGDVEIPSPFWDRLYAELCLVSAHARELARRAEARVH
ncbi:hypothetical protein [Stakelama tenebrarum]|uniref:Uncharacterized protein n=1 Tax=Stakelama tenebrarum TaxID=2711215 RepID=A0A6G6Y446_9SPHN|nr:hypothetical protein [Sphingosinithalassobacter tenebrarum]QIG79680.1 hypothetical protein G5C33_07665 [Sphingosinithalassobacter tenebrarum]